MEVVGRKLYLRWGTNLVLAIEKYPYTDELAMRTGLLDGEGQIKQLALHEIWAMDNQPLERLIRNDFPDTCLGREFQDYMTEDRYWGTQREFDQIAKREYELPYPAVEFGFVVSQELTEQEYEYAYNNVTTVRIQGNGETYWGGLFTNTAVDTCRSFEQSHVPYLCMNNTISGRMSGHIYLGWVDKGQLYETKEEWNE